MGTSSEDAMTRLRRLRRQPAASLGVGEERLLPGSVGEELRELSAHGPRALAGLLACSLAVRSRLGTGTVVAGAVPLERRPA
jgi:hypothetical protein